MSHLNEVETLYKELNSEWNKKPQNIKKCGQLLDQLKVYKGITSKTFVINSFLLIIINIVLFFRWPLQNWLFCPLKMLNLLKMKWFYHVTFWKLLWNIVLSLKIYPLLKDTCHNWNVIIMITSKFVNCYLMKDFLFTQFFNFPENKLESLRICTNFWV